MATYNPKVQYQSLINTELAKGAKADQSYLTRLNTERNAKIAGTNSTETQNAVATSNVKPIVANPVVAKTIQTPAQTAIAGKIATLNSTGGNTVTNNTKAPVIAQPVGYNNNTNYQALIDAEMKKGPLANKTLILKLDGERNAKIDALRLTTAKNVLGFTADPPVNENVLGDVVGNDDKLIALQNKLDELQSQFLTPEERKAELAQLMGTFAPTVSQADYVANATNVANTTANLQYDPLKDDLKKKLATVLSKLGVQTSQLGSKYQPKYQQNEQDKYKAGEDVKKLLSRRGMLGSGVDMGSQMQNSAQYDAQRQAIDLAQTDEATQLQYDMALAEQTASMDEASLDKQKANYIAQQTASAQQGYQDVVSKDKESALSNFWKGQEMGLKSADSQVNAKVALTTLEQNQQKIDVGVKQWGADYGLRVKEFDRGTDQFMLDLGYKYDALTATQKQFYDNLNSEMKKFSISETNKSYQHAEEMGFKYKELKDKGTQFTATLNLSKEQMAQDKTLALAQMANSIASARISAGPAYARLAQEKTEYKDKLNGVLSKSDPDYRKSCLQENDRIDSIITTAASQIAEGKLSSTQLSAICYGAVNGSFIDDMQKKEKVKMIYEVFINKGATISPAP